MKMPGFTAENSLTISSANYVGKVDKSIPLKVRAMWGVRPPKIHIKDPWCKARCATCRISCGGLAAEMPLAFAACLAACDNNACKC